MRITKKKNQADKRHQNGLNPHNSLWTSTVWERVGNADSQASPQAPKAEAALTKALHATQVCSSRGSTGPSIVKI